MSVKGPGGVEWNTRQLTAESFVHEQRLERLVRVQQSVVVRLKDVDERAGPDGLAFVISFVFQFGRIPPARSISDGGVRTKYLRRWYDLVDYSLEK